MLERQVLVLSIKLLHERIKFRDCIEKNLEFFFKVTNKFIPVEKDYKVKQVTLQVQEKFHLSYHSD